VHDTSIPVDRGRISVWYRPAIPGRPTVTLLHGLTGTSRWWLPVISRLPEEVGVIAPDLRGRGQSWETPGPFDLASLASDVSTCLNHYEVPTTTIAGYSMGAWVATMFGSTRQRRVTGIVLVDGGVQVELNPGDEPNDILDKLIGPAVERFGMSFESMEKYLAFWRSHPALAGRWTDQLDSVFAYDVQEERGSYQSRANREALTRGAEGVLFDEQAAKAVYEVSAPTRLLIAELGALDQPGGFISERAARGASARNPNLTVEKLDDLNHYTVLLGAGSSRVASAIVGLL
jgi:pimeloyl-ACP methyl ester carboxylesterase